MTEPTDARTGPEPQSTGGFQKLQKTRTRIFQKEQALPTLWL